MAHKNQPEADRIQQELRTRLYAALPRNPRTSLFPGNQIQILDAATDLNLSQETVWQLIANSTPPYHVAAVQAPWVIWAILQNPAYPLLLLENPALKDRLTGEYLWSLYRSLIQDFSDDSGDFDVWGKEHEVADAVLWLRDLCDDIYPGIPLVTKWCREYASSLLLQYSYGLIRGGRSKSISNLEDWVFEQHPYYPGAEVMFDRVQVPDCLALLYPPQVGGRTKKQKLRQAQDEDLFARYVEAQCAYEAGQALYESAGDLSGILGAFVLFLEIVEVRTPRMAQEMEELPPGTLSDLRSRIQEFLVEYQQNPKNFFIEDNPVGCDWPYEELDHTVRSCAVLRQDTFGFGTSGYAKEVERFELWHIMTEILLTLGWMEHGIAVDHSPLVMLQEELTNAASQAWDWIKVYNETFGHPYD